MGEFIVAFVNHSEQLFLSFFGLKLFVFQLSVEKHDLMGLGCLFLLLFGDHWQDFLEVYEIFA